MCVCERERAREREHVCACARERKRERVCARERKRESVCVRERARAREREITASALEEKPSVFLRRATQQNLRRRASRGICRTHLQVSYPSTPTNLGKQHYLAGTKNIMIYFELIMISHELIYFFHLAGNARSAAPVGVGHEHCLNHLVDCGGFRV